LVYNAFLFGEKEMGELLKCKHNEQASMLMSLALDGMLDAEGQSRLKRHLVSCPSCLAEWKAMRQVSAMLDGSDTVGPPLGFAVHVERRIGERARKRRRVFGGLAVLGSSLPLAGITIAAVVLLIVGIVAWPWLGAQPVVHQGGQAVSQVASGVGLMGRGATLFLRETLLRYGMPLGILVAVGLILLSSCWVWLYTRRSGSNGVAGLR
jgi:predicted anti-sigma-YlaC factor YlaD